jgi:hypothetical protein
MNDSATPASRDEVIRDIGAAFADVAYPGDDQLVYDNSGRHLECTQVREVFRGRSWRDLDLETLRRNASALFFFTPAAYRYYLPAFLIAAVRDFERADVIPDTIVCTLKKPKDSGEDAMLFQQRIEGLSEPQRNAVRSFLSHLATTHAGSDPLGDYQDTLRSYWIEGS